MRQLFNIFAVTLFVLAVVQSRAAELSERWVYIATNHQSDKAMDELEGVMRRAAAAGYTGIQLNDSKFAKLDDLGEMTKVYFKNVERIKKLAAELKLEIIPGIFSIGYSNDVLWHDPNLAEGLSVVDAPFTVANGTATLVTDVRALKKPGFRDPIVTGANGAWTITDPKGANGRLIFGEQKVQPHREYHVSCMMKTHEFQGTPQITILGKGRSLAFANIGTKPTQEWTVQHQVFNSQDCTEIGVYIGCWGGKTGTLEIKDVQLEEVGLLNVLRREGCPFSVKNESGVELKEGTDYEKFADPDMGSKPYNGCFDVYHTPPVMKTHLPDGSKLKISYYHVMTIQDGQVMLCPSEKKTMEILKKEAELVHKAYGAKQYFMHFDEIRCMNQCALCRARKLQPGAILADSARSCTALMHEVAPKARLYTWNDMFDPFHNAVKKDYYLVDGDLTGSWEGLEKSTVIVEWHFDKRNESMAFFEKLGHPLMVAGYYDGSQDTQKWLETMHKVSTTMGIMYTTWEHKFGELENFAKTVHESYAP